MLILSSYVDFPGGVHGSRLAEVSVRLYVLNTSLPMDGKHSTTLIIAEAQASWTIPALFSTVYTRVDWLSDT